MSSSHSSTFFSPCPRGLEPILVDELLLLHAENPEPLRGGVRFVGPFDLCYHVNLKSRIASRVLWEVHQSHYDCEEDIYKAALALPWPTWFSVKHRIKVNVSAQRCPLPSLEFLTLRIKDAICDRFRKAVGARPTVNTRTPDIGIYAFLDHHTVTLYLDTTGEPLFKRGFRKARGEAPLRENLAAGILHLAGWTPEQVLLDPMCGSGTFLLEAALIAGNIAPGLGRPFAFEKFHAFKPEQWKRLRAHYRAQQYPIPPCTIFGYDRNPKALEAATTNITAAGLAQAVTLQQADVLDIKAPTPEGMIVTNPPYGVRSGDDQQLVNWYPRLGDALKQHFVGWRAFIFTADLRLPKLIGLATARRTPLFNGALECRLFEYPIVAGSHRSSTRSLTLPT